MSRRLIGPVDTIWLNMDRANNLMVVDSLMFLDGPVDWDRLVDVGRRRMIERYPVFRQRPVVAASHLGSPHWEDDPDFDVNRHLIRARLDGGGDEAARFGRRSSASRNARSVFSIWYLAYSQFFSLASRPIEIRTMSSSHPSSFRTRSRSIRW